MNQEVDCVAQAPVRVLVVEGDSNIRVVLAAELEGLGFAVSIAGDGRDGLARLHEVSPYAVLVNRLMPDMESDEFLRLLRADPDPALAGTRVVVMTGSVPSAAHSPSPDDYLLRPFRTSALLRALEPAEEQSRRQAS